MNRLTKKTEKQNDLLFSHELNLTDDNEYENELRKALALKKIRKSRRPRRRNGM